LGSIIIASLLKTAFNIKQLPDIYKKSKVEGVSIPEVGKD
jgi:hypothetical protein